MNAQRVSGSIRRLPHAQDLPLPRYQTAGSAGMDLAAAVEATVELHPGDRKLIPTGYALLLPDDYEAQIRPRSGLALAHGVTILNNPGTIDSDYRGEIRVLLVNHGDKVFRIGRGDRIAQIVFARIVRMELRETGTLPATLRGTAGFGSTGIAADGI